MLAEDPFKYRNITHPPNLNRYITSQKYRFELVLDKK